jgi:elongation factor P
MSNQAKAQPLSGPNIAMSKPVASSNAASTHQTNLNPPSLNDQVPFSGASVGDALKFLKDGMVCKVVSYKGEVFAIEPPIFVELEVTECDPGVKGDTAQNATKNAEVETGAVIKVPLFVNQGDMVKIDTRTGEYMERVKA